MYIEHTLRYACRQGDVKRVNKLLIDYVDPTIQYKNTSCLEIVIDRINHLKTANHVVILQQLIDKSWNRVISPRYIYSGLVIGIEYTNTNILEFFYGYVKFLKGYQICEIILLAICREANTKIINNLIDYMLILQPDQLKLWHLFEIIIKLSQASNKHKDKCLNYLYQTSYFMHDIGFKTVRRNKPSIRTVEIIDMLLRPRDDKWNRHIKYYVIYEDEYILKHVKQYSNYPNINDIIMKLPLKKNMKSISAVLSKKYGQFILLRNNYNSDVIMYIFRILFNVLLT